jgi:hypothetical protein
MRRSLPLALILCLTIGCGDDTAPPDDDSSTTTTEPSTQEDSSTPVGTEDTAAEEDAGPTSPEDDDTAIEEPPESDTVSEEDTATTAPVDPNPEDNHGHALATSATYGEACPQNSRIGHFQVTHDEFYAAVTGTVASGVIPLTILQPVLESGDCVMLQKVNPFCDPPCGGGDLCEHDGSCIPYPANQNLGTVSISGLLKDPLTMEPNASDYYTDVAVPFPLFNPNAQVDLVAEGNELEGFALRAWGLPNVMLPIDPSTDETVIWEMESGTPLTVEWDAEPGPWRMIVSLNVDQHGNSPVTMFCDVEDTGSAVIDAALIDTLLGYGVSGFATADFRRTTVDSLQLGDVGCVQMSVESLMLGKLTVAGHVPCKFDPDCPVGYVCEMAIETCVEAE